MDLFYLLAQFEAFGGQYFWSVELFISLCRLGWFEQDLRQKRGHD